VVELINTLVHNNLVNIDYFGGEMDNQADYVDESMQELINSTSYITLHFDQMASDSIEYDIDEESALNLVISILMENQIRDVTVDKKDIDVYIY
jgi:ABC-type microcin C transport system permease subunit YejE